MAEKNGTSPSFEKALERLEAIVAEMEGGTLNLDRMMAHFEEGSKLVRICSAKLNEVEKKIEVLVKKGGETVTEPFTGGTEEQPRGKGQDDEPPF